LGIDSVACQRQESKGAGKAARSRRLAALNDPASFPRRKITNETDDQTPQHQPGWYARSDAERFQHLARVRWHAHGQRRVISQPFSSTDAASRAAAFSLLLTMIHAAPLSKTIAKLSKLVFR